MLNPSIADEWTDDPTIRKCRGFTTRAGRTGLERFCERLAVADGSDPVSPPSYTGLRVVNLYPLRATDPARLRDATEAQRMGPDGHADLAIETACAQSAAVVCAWGANGARYPERVARVRSILAASGRPLYYLGLTRDGSPFHPLMIPYSTPLSRWTTERHS